ncbi:MAG: T9SS type A sorting domain-containing protein, partial [Ignavibacteria bacterium]
NDELHIYALDRRSGNHLVVSDNSGELSSWTTRYSSSNNIFISVDYFHPGSIYLADGKYLHHSTDFGGNFNLYKSLNRNIVGIYKKPNSDKVYAATKYKIYEITTDTIQVIKTLPIPDAVLNYYPLAIGNRWVYDESTVTHHDPYPNYSHRILVKEVLKDTIASNGKKYYKINDETLWENSVLERVDSSEGKVYRYYEDQSLPEDEYLAYDLLAEVGDTLLSSRMGFTPVGFTTMYAESMFDKWELTKPKKVFVEYTLQFHPPIFSLTQDIGLDSIYSYFDFGDTYITLKGCVINGIIYGDTTVVSVEDETLNLPSEFSLSQNFPNPFNPTTKIVFTIPVVVDAKFASRTNVILKVYDVLGNEITTLVNEEKPIGEYEVEFNGAGLPSGVYFYQLRAGSFVETKKMVYLK